MLSSFMLTVLVAAFLLIVLAVSVYFYERKREQQEDVFDKSLSIEEWDEWHYGPQDEEPDSAISSLEGTP